jgi:hypothetical protein
VRQGGHHTDKNGQVIVNKTGDVGLLQINEPIHGAEAKRKGYDIYKIDGNIAFGIMLFEREGLQPWAASTNIKTLKYNWDIVLPVKTSGPGTEYTVADRKGGQPCTDGHGMPKPKP